MSRELLQQALDEFDNIYKGNRHSVRPAVIESIRTALASPEQPCEICHTLGENCGEHQDALASPEQQVEPSVDFKDLYYKMRREKESAYAAWERGDKFPGKVYPASEEIKLPQYHPIPHGFCTKTGLPMFHPQMLEDYAIAAVELNRKPASEDKPVGWVTDCVTRDNGKGEYIWGNGTFVCSSEIKSGTKLYTRPAPADQVRDAAKAQDEREAFESAWIKKGFGVDALARQPDGEYRREWAFTAYYWWSARAALATTQTPTKEQ